MKDALEVYHGIQDLLATMEEALQHIPTQLEELRLEASFKLLIDFTEGVRSIEEAVSKIVPLASGGENLHQSLNTALAAYEGRDAIRIKAIVQDRLLPAFATWRIEVWSNGVRPCVIALFQKITERM